MIITGVQVGFVFFNNFQRVLVNCTLICKEHGKRFSFKFLMVCLLGLADANMEREGGVNLRDALHFVNYSCARDSRRGGRVSK